MWTDYLWFSLGILDGAMGALPQQSYTYYCNKNSSAARASLQNVVLYFSSNQTTKGMAALHTMLGYTGNIGKNCYMGVNETIKADTYSKLFVGDTLLTNVLYNLGYMYNDLWDIFSND